MKKFYSLLAVMLAVLAMPQAWGRWTINKRIISAEEIVPSKYYVIEPLASTMEDAGDLYSVKGKYMKGSDGKYTATLTSDIIWQFQEAEVNGDCGVKQYRLYNEGTKQWLGSSAGRNSSLAENATLVMVNGAHSLPVTKDGVSYNFSCTNENSDITDDAVTFAIGVNKNDGSVDFMYRTYDCTTWMKKNNISYPDAQTHNSWNLYEAVYEDTPQQDLQDYMENVDKSQFTQYTIGDGPYFYIREAVEGLMNAIDHANTIKDQDGLDKEEYRSAMNDLKERIAAIGGQYHPFVSGYYIIKTANSAWTGREDQAVLFTEGGRVKWGPYDETNAAKYVFQVEQNGSKYYFRNMGDASYFAGARNLGSGESVPTATDKGANMLDVKMASPGMVTLKNYVNTARASYYYQSNADGVGPAAVVTGENGVADASCWQIIPFTDAAAIQQMETHLADLSRVNHMRDLVSEANNWVLMSKNYTTLISEPLITDVTQFSSNAKEPSEGSFDALLDDNYDDASSFFHSVWEGADEIAADYPDFVYPEDYHYLQVNAKDNGTFPATVFLSWTRRNQSSNANRPTAIGVTASADGESWTLVDSLYNPTASFPTSANILTYTSPQALNIPDGTKMLRFTVYQTNTPNAVDDNGHPFFTFSAFNLHETIGRAVDPTTSQYAREEMKQPVDSLEAAIAHARELVTAGTVTEQDSIDLQTALDNVLALWVDSTVITSQIYDAEALVANAFTAPEEGIIGSTPQDAIDALRTALAAARAKAPFYVYTKAEIDAISAELKTAVDAFTAATVSIEPGEWYTIVCNDKGNKSGLCLSVSPKYDSTNDGFVRAAKPENESKTDAISLWKFIDLGSGKYAVQNIATGWLLGSFEKPFLRLITTVDTLAWEIVPIGGNETSLRLSSDKNCMRLTDPDYSGNGYLLGEDKPEAGTASSWRFSKVEKNNVNIIKKYVPGYSCIVTLPYSTYEHPYSDDAEVKLYDLTGAEYVEGTGEIRALNFTEIPEDETIEAGRTFLMHVGEAEDKSLETVDVNMCIDEETEHATESTPQNGMIGLLRTSYFYGDENKGYLFNDGDNSHRFCSGISVMDSVQVATPDLYYFIWGQEGYFDPSLISNIPNKPVDFQLFVAGQPGNKLTEIKNAVSTRNGKVDVCTLDGVVLKRNVNAATALQGLRKGLYLVGKRKVIVK